MKVSEDYWEEWENPNLKNLKKQKKLKKITPKKEATKTKEDIIENI